MESSVITELFLVLNIGAAGWLIMVLVLLHGLKARHLQKYLDLGEPSLFRNNIFQPRFTCSSSCTRATRRD